MAILLVDYSVILQIWLTTIVVAFSKFFSFYEIRVSIGKLFANDPTLTDRSIILKQNVKENTDLIYESKTRELTTEKKTTNWKNITHVITFFKHIDTETNDFNSQKRAIYIVSFMFF